MGTTTTTVNGQLTALPVVFDGAKMYAPSIQLNYRPRDVGIAPSQEAPSTGNASLGSAGTSDGQQGDAQLPGATIGAILISALFGFILTCAAVAGMFVYVRKRASKTRKADNRWAKAELDSAAPADTGVRLEIDTCERYELDGSTCMGAELNCESPVSELSAYHKRHLPTCEENSAPAHRERGLPEYGDFRDVKCPISPLSAQ